MGSEIARTHTSDCVRMVKDECVHSQGTILSGLAALLGCGTWICLLRLFSLHDLSSHTPHHTPHNTQATHASASMADSAGGGSGGGEGAKPGKFSMEVGSVAHVGCIHPSFPSLPPPPSPTFVVCVFKKPVFKKKGGGTKQQNKRGRKQASDSGSGR